jgi:ABC-2 type transport system ATP-binding protein
VISNAENGSVTLIPESGQVILKQVNTLIHARDWDVEEFHVEKGQLDDVFRKVTENINVIHEHSRKEQA